MQPEPIGPLRVYTVPRGVAPTNGPAILLCHGYGATGDDLVALAQMIDAGPGVRWFFPEAPLPVEFNGFVAGLAWWPIDLERVVALQRRGQPRALASEMPEGLAEAREALEATIAELCRAGEVRRDELILGGFSQGAMLATEVALHAEDAPFAGLAVLSGNLLCEDRWSAAAKKIGSQFHAFLTHGRADPLLPFEGAVALRDLLVANGADVEWIPHQGQHEIPPEALRGLAAFARARFARHGRHGRHGKG